MATVSFLGVAQGSINYILNGQVVQNNVFVKKDGEWTTGSLDDLGELLEAWVIAEMLPLLSTDIDLRDIYTVDRGSPTGPFSLEVCSSGCAGTVGSSAPANQVAAVVEFLTGQRGRAYRGRNYVGGVPGNALNDGLFSETFVGNLVSAYEQLNLDLTNEGWDHVVASASLCDPETPCIGFTTNVTQYRASLSPGVRRSRRITESG